MVRADFVPGPANIKVIGLGGGGCNAIERMVREGIPGVQFFAVNTDAQALLQCEAPTRICIGEKLTRGLGVGGDCELGMKAAEESRAKLHEALADADMVFLTAGMGGGTGTGAASIVAEIAKENGALTIGVVTRPFGFEGKRRREVADRGIDRLVNALDTLIIIPNDRLLSICEQKTLMQDAFRLADDVLRHGVQAIAELITIPGEINLDFADVKAVMNQAGPAWMSIGSGNGQNRAIDAAKAAIASPLLDVSIEGAKGVLFNVTGGNDLSLHEVNLAAAVISQAVDPEANIIFGMVINSQMENEIRITLIATGLTSKITAPKEEELRQLIKEFQEEGKLDVPTFLRRPFPLWKQQVPSSPAKVESLSFHQIKQR